jgi:hypothetical protein
MTNIVKKYESPVPTTGAILEFLSSGRQLSIAAFVRKFKCEYSVIGKRLRELAEVPDSGVCSVTNGGIRYFYIEIAAVQDVKPINIAMPRTPPNLKAKITGYTSDLTRLQRMAEGSRNNLTGVV